MRKKEIVLPSLPYGEGNYSWMDKEHTRIRFRKKFNGKYKSVTGTTVQECNKKMKIIESENLRKEKEHQLSNPQNNALTLAQSALNWMDTFKRPTLKGKAYDTMESTYNSQIKTAPFADYQVATIMDTDIQGYLEDLVSVQHKSLSTVKKAHSFFCQYFAFIYKTKPYENPMINVKMPKPQNNITLDTYGNINNAEEVYGLNKEYEIMDDDEITKFIYAATVPRIQGVQGYRHGWGLVFMLWTFIRNGEALGLQWKDIDFENKTALVYKSFSRIIDRENSTENNRKYKWALSTVKTAKSVRKFYLSEQAIYALNEYKKVQNPKSENDFIFQTENNLPINNSNLNLMMKKILSNAGIDKHITIHGLRHTGISYYIRHGVDKEIVAKMAGHSTSKITEDVYYTILNDQELAQLDKINKMVK